MMAGRRNLRTDWSARLKRGDGVTSHGAAHIMLTACTVFRFAFTGLSARGSFHGIGILPGIRIYAVVAGEDEHRGRVEAGRHHDRVCGRGQGIGANGVERWAGREGSARQGARRHRRGERRVVLLYEDLRSLVVSLSGGACDGMEAGDHLGDETNEQRRAEQDQERKELMMSSGHAASLQALRALKQPLF